jgi:hypothetical protein
MDQHESVKASAPSGEAATPSVPVIRTEVTPKMALASLDFPRIDAPRIDAPRMEGHRTDAPRAEMPRIEMARLETQKLDMWLIATPKADPDRRTFDMPMDSAAMEMASTEAPHLAPDVDAAQAAGTAAAAESEVEEPTVEPPQPPEPPVAERAPIVSKFMLLAASLALAAGIGGMVGALGALALSHPGPTPVMAAGRTGIDEIHALKENVVQARVELAALKASIDAGNRNAGAQFTKIGERIDRVERLQADPAAKLNKAVEALDRLARADTAVPKEITGSIQPLPSVSGPPKPLGSVDGWILRDVRRGTALIEGRMGIIEVDQGDIVPGLGRIDAIRKQADGRWVVITTRGLIMSAR